MVEDAWLGAALWRFVGRSLPINVFTLNTRWGHLYVDGDGFRVSPSTVTQNGVPISSCRR